MESEGYIKKETWSVHLAEGGTIELSRTAGQWMLTIDEGVSQYEGRANVKLSPHAIRALAEVFRAAAQEPE